MWRIAFLHAVYNFSLLRFRFKDYSHFISGLGIHYILIKLVIIQVYKIPQSQCENLANKLFNLPCITVIALLSIITG